MKIHEYQASQLFQKAGIPIVPGQITTDVNQALEFARSNGYPVVLKSQVLVGGRGKAGGIKLVKNETELKEKFEQLTKLTISGYAVKKIYVVKAIDIRKEYYLATIVDTAKDDIVLIASSDGGVEIEETAKKNPDAIKKYYLQGERSLHSPRFKDFIASVFDSDSLRAQGTKIFEGLIKVFFDNDCSLAEINPLVIDGTGTIYAADAKVNLDDNALIRHEELAKLRDLDYENADELEANQQNLSFVKLEGNVGCIVNGAGLAMATMDIVKLSGGKPANFLDVGGSSNPEKVLNALKIILRSPEVKAILINIFGGITRCDDIANGILAAKKQMNLSQPMVIRLTGTNEKEAKEILKKAGIDTFSTMREAVNKVVELANK
ncbi:MAG: ADP-forming succinate--CoA ligase subunit beta [Candidatus Omnitrophica bacterium]|nr:ADP-forming succinate--CoA ligase subunit beta [Candidatus Omnitrophota bacterium]